MKEMSRKELEETMNEIAGVFKTQEEFDRFETHVMGVKREREKHHEYVSKLEKEKEKYRQWFHEEKAKSLEYLEYKYAFKRIFEEMRNG